MAMHTSFQVRFDFFNVFYKTLDKIRMWNKIVILLRLSSMTNGERIM